MTDPRIRKAWAVWVRGGWPGEHTTVFASTAWKARYAAYLGWDWRPYLKITDIRVRRAAHRDIRLPPLHRLVADLTPQQRQIVSHAYGRDRNGNGYRSHYCTAPGNVDLLRLSWEYGLFTGPHGERAYGDTDPWVGAFFYLTELGKHVAASMLPTYTGDVE